MSRRSCDQDLRPLLEQLSYGLYSKSAVNFARDYQLSSFEFCMSCGEYYLCDSCSFSFFFFISLYYRSSIGTVFDADSTKEFTTTSHGQLYKAASWNSWPKTELMALARRACWVVLLPRRLKESEIQRDEARCFQDILKVIGSPMHTHVFMFARRAKYHRPYHCPVNPVLLFQLPFS